LSIFLHRVVIYKAPALNIGKALIAGPAPVAWRNTPVLTQANNNHAVFKSLEHVIRADAGNKFIAYNNILVKKLKTSIKVWTTRDKTLKSDCRILGRNIKLIASPIAVNGDASSLDSDVSQWLISDPGNKFCAIDKPYHKSQTKEPAMAVCIDDATIFGHFNLIGQNQGNTYCKASILRNETDINPMHCSEETFIFEVCNLCLFDRRINLKAFTTTKEGA
ncbi:hypothetical protein T02_2171, partial [Trichinella nativa]